MNWINQHLIACLAGSSGFMGYAIAYLVHKVLPGLLSKEQAKIESFLNKEISKLTPDEKKLILDCDVWVESLQPVADSKVVAAVAMIVAKVPQIAPYSALIADALTAIVSAAAQIAADEAKNLQ